MNAVRKPSEHERDAASQASPAPASTQGAKPAKPDAASGRENPAASPVHALRARIEMAFRPPSERAMLRITTMVLVLALSSWLAAVMLLSAA